MTFVFDARSASDVGVPFLTPSPIVAQAHGGSTLRAYGRAVWATARDEALAWRRTGTGIEVARAARAPDAVWWAAVDGPFETTGGVLDLAYRAHVLRAALADARNGVVRAYGADDDPWLGVLRRVCVAAGRELDARIREGDGSHGGPARRHQLELAGRYAWSRMLPGISRADVLLVLTHGRMAVRDAAGTIADRYSVLFAEKLRATLRVATVSLEPPRPAWTDAAAIARGEYLPWMSFLAPSELWRLRTDRALWEARLAASDAFTFHAGGVDLTALLAGRPRVLAARGMALAQAYATAFARAIERSAARAVVAVEGHSNAGRAIGLASPGLRLLAPQGGIVSPDGSTNAAYDHRGLLAFSGMHGCPVPHRSLVWGPYYRDVLSGLGHDAQQVVVAGLPRPVARSARLPLGHVLFAAGANDDVCAFAAGFDEEIATIRALREQVAPSRRVIVRLHPSHDVTRYASALPSSVDVVSGVRPLEGDLRDAAVVIGRSTTVLIEAVAAGRPAVVANLGAVPDLTGLAAAGLPYVDDESSLGPAIADAIASPLPPNVVATPVGDAAAELIVAAAVEAAR